MMKPPPGFGAANPSLQVPDTARGLHTDRQVHMLPLPHPIKPSGM